jgi:hypothetical protein
MGKGKGGRQGVWVRVHAGTALAAFSALRRGLVSVLRQRYQVRVPFRVAVCWPDHRAPALGAQGSVGTPCRGGVRLRAIQPHWVTQQFHELRYYLQKIAKPLLTQYFLRLFRWRQVVPHAA